MTIMDMSADPHSRGWFHQSMYLSTGQHGIYSESPGGMSGAGIGNSSQSYTTDAADHYHSYNHESPVSNNTEWARAAMAAHNPYHASLCHPVSPHHTSPVNTPDGSPNCGSRLYLPSSVSCSSRTSHPSLHLPISCSNPASMWHSSFPQHIMSQSPSATGSTLNLPQFSSTPNSHTHGIPNLKTEAPMGPPALESSPHYQDDFKLKLTQSSMGYPGFPPQLYPPHIGGSEFLTNSLMFDMATGMPRCRTGSRSNSGMYIGTCRSYLKICQKVFILYSLNLHLVNIVIIFSETTHH